VTSDQWPVQ